MDKKIKGQREPKDAKEITKELELAQKERDEYLAGWKRSKADLANFRKETEQAISELADAVKINFTAAFLPVVDSLEESAKNNIEGLEHIRSLLSDIFKKEGLEETKSETGDDFNPEIHEAIEGEGEKIDKVICKGYKYKDRVVRPVKVKVGK